MASLKRTTRQILGCHGNAASCAAIGALSVRTVEIAEDEVMIIAAEGTEAAVATEAVRTVARQADPHVYVVDDTDAWTVWRASLADAECVFSALSALRWSGEEFVQGRMAGVPVRIVRESGELLIALLSVYDATFEREATHAGVSLR